MKGSSDKRKLILSAAAVAQAVCLSGQLHLTAEQIVRAWESPEFRQSLTVEQQKALPSNPAGELQFPAAGAQYVESTQFAGCGGTVNNGCGDTQFAGCGGTVNNGCGDTQFAGCGNTQYEGCGAYTLYQGCLG
jgi:mersacidin/lichenicidin family type 2 lantibiotic